MTLNWKNVEKKLDLTPKQIAHMAGIDASMYYKVRNRHRKLSMAGQFMFFVQVAIEKDYKGRGIMIEEAVKLAREFERDLIA